MTDKTRVILGLAALSAVLAIVDACPAAERPHPTAGGSRLTVHAACAQGPYVASGNFTADLDGRWMTSESGDIWGLGDAWIFPLTFQPPAGARVRVLEVAGDLTARFTTRGAGPATARPGEFTGALVAVQTLPTSSGSVRGDWMADDTLVYAQGDVSAASGALRIPFRQDLRGVVNTLLEPDHRLYFKIAKYLDETRQTTHFEVTFTVIYHFEPEEGCDASF